VSASDPSSRDKRSKYILIVDDDQDAREMLGEIIGSLGHHAVPAATAREAIEQAERTRLDLALIDLGIPDADGCEIARRIRLTVSGAGIRLVALTGYSDSESRRTAAEAGFDDFLVKPAPANAIAELVNAARLPD
jgi:CheY-like chemotaxis protein